MKKASVWKIDLAICLVVVIGFEIIDYNLTQLEQAPFYYEFITTAKWLLIGGFTFHGLLNYLTTRSR